MKGKKLLKLTVKSQPFTQPIYTVRHKKTHQNSFVHNFAKY